MPPNKPTVKQVSGPVHAVPCAHCGTKIDLRELIETGVIADTEQQAEVDCSPREGQDPRGFCGRISRVVGIQPVTIVSMIQSPRNNEIIARRRAAGPIASTPGHGQLIPRRRR